MNKTSLFIQNLLGDVGTVFYLSAVIIAGFVVLAASYPDDVARVAQQVLDFTAYKMGWMYLLEARGKVLPFARWPAKSEGRPR